MFKTGEDFYLYKKDTDKDKKEFNNHEEININDSINLDDFTKKIRISQKNEEKNKIENNYGNNKQNIDITVKTMDDINSKKNINITVKTMDDIKNKKLKKNIIDNTSDRVSLSNSPMDIHYQKNRKRGASIPYERRISDMQDKDVTHHSSSKLFHQVVNSFYSKEFPNKINTNEILKLMLFFNEYLINNNLLNDFYNKENRKLLNDYSKYISSKIKVDFPQEHDIVVDSSIKCVKKIQRKWRKRQIDVYLKKTKKNETDELKHMIIKH